MNSIILFVTTDMSLIYTKCNKNALVSLRVYGDNKYFPKNSSFFHNFI
jgi:hypothetical protein